MKSIIKELKSDKASSGDIPTKALKQCDFSYEALTKCINESINSGSFLDQLKIQNITPVYKAKDPFDKANYRPISILPFLSKVHEKVILKQPSIQVKKFLSQIRDFRKAHSAQHALFRLLQP